MTRFGFHALAVASIGVALTGLVGCGQRHVLEAGGPVSGPDDASPTLWPTPDPSPTPDPDLVRVFGLGDIPGEYDRNVSFDQTISRAMVAATFLPDAQPNLRGLIVTKPYLDTVIAPGSPSNPDGNDAFALLYGVLEHGHLLYVLDATSNEIIDRLGWRDRAAPFDKEEVPLNGWDDDPNSLQAGTGLVYEFQNSDVGPGWVFMTDSSSAPNIVNETSLVTDPPLRDESGVMGVLPTPDERGIPPYQAVYESVYGYIVEHEARAGR